MKKLVAALALTASSVVMANPYHHGHRHHHHRPHVAHHHGHWIAPLIIGGVVGAAIAANRVEAQTQAPVVVVQPQPIVQSNAVITLNEQGQQIVTCPAGLFPFEKRAYLRNQFGQFVETSYIQCQ